MLTIFFVAFSLFIHSTESSSVSGAEPALAPAGVEENGTAPGGILHNLDKCANSSSHGGCINGLIVPAWTPHVGGIPASDVVARAIIYFLSLAYLFVGVSIIADRFVAAIEVITSQEREVKVKKANGQTVTVMVRIWNETVSNLTLAALGTSAPEICLSVIEVINHNFDQGDLGPGTIVGAAAFNMFNIIAICMMSIPNSEVRRIKHYYVFWVTVSWALFAYAWLYLILEVITPGFVHWWEGLLTLSFFPMTVITAYITDKKMHGSMGETTVVEDAEHHRSEYIDILRSMRQQNPDADIETIERLAQQEIIKRQPKSMAFYRVQAMQKMTGGGDITKRVLHDEWARRSTKIAPHEMGLAMKELPRIALRFDPGSYSCFEDCGTILVTVVCERKAVAPCTVCVDYRTEDGTAPAHVKYIPTSGTLTFGPDQSSQKIRIEIIDNDLFEEDQIFYVNLSNPKVFDVATRIANPGHLPKAQLQSPFTASVTIVDNDHAGEFEFEHPTVECSEEDSSVSIRVMRERGARGIVTVPYKTISGTAKGDEHFSESAGKLVFNDEETEKKISIAIINSSAYDASKYFYIQLDEPIWKKPLEMEAGTLSTEAIRQAEAGRPVLGSVKQVKVTIQESQEFKNFVDKMMKTNQTTLLLGSQSWQQQFQEALTIGGGESEEDKSEQPSRMDYAMHWLTLPWKLLFALVPPTAIWNGWACFIVSIFMIGILSALIGDLASHFGCTVGLKDTVTAISMVALGTSLPDTFASKAAAVQDEYADSSIVHVTGSTAINVFMGIGLAWTVASVYHAANGAEFKVVLFFTGSCIVIATLQFRRYIPAIRGEFGGPRTYKLICGALFISIWILYVSLSALDSYCIVDVNW